MDGRVAGLLGGDREALVTTLLGVALVAAVLAVVGFALVPAGTGDPYTEFYVLGENGTASDYPDNVTVGEEATLLVGVGNFENREQTYTLVLRTDGTVLEERTVTLSPEARWEEPVTVAFDTAGRKRLHLELYRGGTTEGEPSQRLRLFVRVLER